MGQLAFNSRLQELALYRRMRSSIAAKHTTFEERTCEK